MGGIGWAAVADTALKIGGEAAGMWASHNAAKQSRKFQREMFERNAALQREFAQHGIQWKVQDAKTAGIHPLYALGANTMSYSPTSVGGSFADDSDSYRRMGQYLGDAARRVLDREAQKVARQKTQLTLENMSLQNDLLRSQIAGNFSTIWNKPGVPSTVPYRPGYVPDENVVPLTTTKTLKSNPSVTTGKLPMTSYVNTGTGLMPVASPGAKQATEDSFIPENIINLKQYSPLLNQKTKPPKSYLPKGYNDWEWSKWNFEWRPVKKTKARKKLEQAYDRKVNYEKRLERYIKDINSM